MKKNYFLAYLIYCLVAQRLLVKGEFDVFNHKVSLSKFERARATQIHRGIHEELDDAAERSVEVHGDVGKLDKNYFKMYMENEKRSGGGKVKKIDFDAKPVVVTFHEIEGNLLDRKIKSFMQDFGTSS